MHDLHVDEEFVRVTAVALDGIGFQSNLGEMGAEIFIQSDIDYAEGLGVVRVSDECV